MEGKSAVNLCSCKWSFKSTVEEDKVEPPTFPHFQVSSPCLCCDEMSKVLRVSKRRLQQGRTSPHPFQCLWLDPLNKRNIFKSVPAYVNVSHDMKDSELKPPCNRGACEFLYHLTRLWEVVESHDWTGVVGAWHNSTVVHREP